MSYMERYVKYGKEETWGVAAAMDQEFNGLRAVESEITEVRSDHPLIIGARDTKGRSYLQREAVGMFRHEILSARFFEFIIGTVGTAEAATVGPWTIVPQSTLPSFTMQRVWGPESTLNCMKIWGCKVDRAEFTFEPGDMALCEVSFAGKDGTIETVEYSQPTIDYTLQGYPLLNCYTKYGSETLSLNRVSFTYNNNLSAKYAGTGTVSSHGCTALREGEVVLDGRFTIDSDLGKYAEEVLRRGEGTISIVLWKNSETITFTLSNIALGPYRERLEGLEQLEIEFPFTARGTTGYDIVKVVQESTYSTFNNMPV